MLGFVVSPGFEDVLVRELGAATSGLGPRWPGLVTVTAAGDAGDPVFARQVLPAVAQVKGTSVTALAEAAYAICEAVLDVGDGLFAVHAYVPDAAAYRSLAGRTQLVEAAFLSLLRERRRRAFRRYRATVEPGLPTAAPELVVQLALVGRGSLLVSAAGPRPLPAGGFDLAPWPAGLAPVEEDRQAPSRAYRKLAEGFAWLGRAPVAGETCVDLGGSPGGWAWLALKRGARVTAIDRSPLAPPAAGHRALTAIIGNAFTFTPKAPVDWLLCDVICEPARTVELVELWMKNAWCRHVVATIKFRGPADLAALSAARVRLAAPGWRFVRIKHLYNHHNEAAILASR